MHPTRRKQETLGIVAVLLAIPLIAVGGIIAATLGGALVGVSALSLLVSRSSPPPQHKPQPQRKVKTDKRIPAGTFRVRPWETVGQGAGRKPCGARCQYSKKPKTTCDCSCLGRFHGSKS